MSATVAVVRAVTAGVVVVRAVVVARAVAVAVARAVVEAVRQGQGQFSTINKKGQRK